MPDTPPSPGASDSLAKCCAIVPFMDAILHPVEAGLRVLERLDVKVFRRPGCSAIDFARSALASMALVHGYESILFIDSDVLFNPADAIYLLRRPEPIVAGVYSQKGSGLANVMVFRETTEIPWGDRGIDLEVRAVGAGFLRIRKEAFETIVNHYGLPDCYGADASGNSHVIWPFFQPFAAPDELTERISYHTEDAAFCRMARGAGLKIIADTRIRLSHLGIYEYTWDDVTRPKQKAVGGVVPVVHPEPGLC